MHRLILLMFVVIVSGCADSGDEGFFIRNNIAPGEGCVITPGGAFLSRGEIALGSPDPYILTPEIESRITATDENQSQRTVALRGARIDLSVESMTVDGAPQTPPPLTNAKFSSLFSASLSPLGSTTASFDVVSAAALNELRSKAPATGAVRIQLLAKATVYGNLGGGDDEIEGVPFYYPVTVCNDCIISVIGTCPLPVGTTPRPGNVCNQFQDGVVDCCIDASNTIICPGPVSTTPPA